MSYKLSVFRFMLFQPYHCNKGNKNVVSLKINPLADFHYNNPCHMVNIKSPKDLSKTSFINLMANIITSIMQTWFTASTKT